nr:hypothetical protein [uncultured Bacillus sp.]
MRPSTILLLLILGITLIIGFLFWFNLHLKRVFKMKITYWLIAIYVFLLLAGAAAMPFIGKDMRILDTQKQQKEEDFSFLMEKLENGQMEKIDKKYIAAENNFAGLTEPTLTITANLEGQSTLYVERKEQNDGKIKVITYQQPIIIDGMNFSELLKPYQIELNDNTLTIHSDQQSIELSIMHPPFPIRQFTAESMMNHSATDGDQFIYLKVPPDLKLQTNESLYIKEVK